MKNDKKLVATLEKTIARLEAKEDKLLYKENFLKAYGKKNLAPLQARVTEKIPPQLENTLVKAFSGAFKMIFQKGLSLIEKTYSEADVRNTNEQSHQKLEASGGKKIFKNHKRQLKDFSWAMGEGIGMGIFGISLPDIPIFIGTLLRTCMISAQSTGVDTSQESERYMMLHLIALSVATDDNKKIEQMILRELSKNIDDESNVFYDLESAIVATSEQLARTMLLSRFVMGVPLVGVAGGLYHSTLVLRLKQLADIYYEKRLLYRKRNAAIAAINRKG